MANFRQSFFLPPLSGDVNRDLALLRQSLFSLEEELRYILLHLGKDNFQDGDLHFLTQGEYEKLMAALAAEQQEVNSR